MRHLYHAPKKKKIKINIDFLKEKVENPYDEQFYTEVHFVMGNLPLYRILNIWDCEDDFEEFQEIYFELKRYFSPVFARTLHDEAHSELSERMRGL